ncbi:MAG: RHS repeat protein, partial [Myxococcales bacterium]|nr:RHS repeat protein [Myxococcales bacterium]
MYLSTEPPSDDIADLAKKELGDAWDKTPTAVLIDKVQRGEFSWIDLLEMDSPKDIIEGTANAFVQHFVDLLASKVPFGASPAASVGDLHIGSPHVHLLPVPHPMPLTVGPITSGCCQSVTVRGWPAARVGDFGFAACLCAAPFFKIKTGSSSVFIGGKRAARMFDISQHGTAPMTPAEMVKAVVNGARKTVAVLARGRRQVNECEEEAKREMEEASRAMLDLLESATGAAGYVSAAAGPAGAAARRGSLVQRVATDAQVSTELRATVAAAIADASSASATASAVAMAGKVAASQMGTDADATAIEAAMALDPTTPPSIGALVAFRDNVVIGGFPTPDIPVPLGHFAKLAPERIRAPLRRADAKIRLKLRIAGIRVHARIDERFPRVSRALTGDPVDVVTGAVLSEGVDAVLRGRGDLVVRRFYSSAWADRPSPLGRGWSLSLDQAVWVEGSFLVYRTDDGRELTYALPEGRRATDERLDGLILVDPSNNLRLVALADGRWRITGAEGAIVELQPIPGERRREAHLARAVAIRGPGEVRVDLHHDARGRLVAASGPGGRTLGLRWDAEDRLEALTLPDPEGPGEVEHVRYLRSPADDLVAVVDAAGGRWRYAYADHRLVEATGPDGRSFYFEYDGPGAQARATRTWGDGGVFERRLCYDTQRRRTVIADGVGGATIVEYDGFGLVSAITDPDG